MVDFKIDFVVPYVDCNDEEWRRLYIDTRRKYNMPVNSRDMVGVRYRELGFFKYFFRGLYYFLPWINNIYIILQSRNQIPKWLNINNEKIHIVLHEEIIPKVFLPTYNSTTIEMFIKNIKGLSEYFLYANDDMYAIRETTPDMFFTDNGIPKYKMIRSNKLNNQYRKVCYKEFEMIRERFNGNSLGKNMYLKPQHVYQPMVLSNVKETYEDFELEILNSISTFREEKNLNQYIYSIHQIYKTGRVPRYPEYKYFELGGYDITEASRCIKKQECYIICLNDSNKTEEERAKEKIIPSFEKILGNKCGYEI